MPALAFKPCQSNPSAYKYQHTLKYLHQADPPVRLRPFLPVRWACCLFFSLLSCLTQQKQQVPDQLCTTKPWVRFSVTRLLNLRTLISIKFKHKSSLFLIEVDRSRRGVFVLLFFYWYCFYAWGRCCEEEESLQTSGMTPLHGGHFTSDMSNKVFSWRLCFYFRDVKSVLRLSFLVVNKARELTRGGGLRKREQAISSSGESHWAQHKTQPLHIQIF